MNWAFCGTDRDGREIGYAIEATCDEDGCDVRIDRGLAYACGEMHGEDEWWCHRYFCDQHLYPVEYPEDRPYHVGGGTVCAECMSLIEKEVG